MADWDPFFNTRDEVSRTPSPPPPTYERANIVRPAESWFERMRRGLSFVHYFNPPEPLPAHALFTLGISNTALDMTRVEEFVAGHADRVTSLHVNFDGSRILTASADHRIKVWDRNRETGQRTLIDTWTAHDADIRDAKWLHPTTGTHIASIGNDLRFRLWTEDTSQSPNSGRRFKLTSQIQNTTRIPWVSLDIKNIESVYTFVAIVDRQGFLSVYEPSNPDEFKDWTLIDQWWVCVPPPARGADTSFRVRFDPNPMPLPYVNNLSDDRNMLSLAVTALEEVKIYRSVTELPNTADGGSNASSKQLRFYEAATIPRAPALVRDVQWAPFNVRGSDLIATACRDGGVRIYEIEITPNPEMQGNGSNTASSSSNNNNQQNTGSRSTNQISAHPSSQQTPRPGQPQSSLTSAITSSGTSNPAENPVPTGWPGPHPAIQLQQMRLEEHQRQFPTAHSTFPTSRLKISFPYTHTITQVADLEDVHEDCWAIAWNADGQVLMSQGWDAKTKMWKKGIMQNGWMLFADQEVTLESDGEEQQEEGAAAEE